MDVKQQYNKNNTLWLCADTAFCGVLVFHDDWLLLLLLCYRKNSKNWDTLNYYRDCPTNGIVGFYSAILRSKDADRITNRVDTDQTAP